LIVGEAVNGIDAIQKAEELRPDLILMDITMLRMDGLPATRAIKKSLPETRIIIVSQNDPGIVQQQATEVDADEVVAKSELPQQLIPAIASFGRQPTNDSSVQASPSSSPSIAKPAATSGSSWQRLSP
jgi:CheY-like chemotaxis protein